MRRYTIYFGNGFLLLVLVFVFFYLKPKRDVALASLSQKDPASKHVATFTTENTSQSPAKDGNYETIHASNRVLKAELQTLKSRLSQNSDREATLRLLREFTQKAFLTNPDEAAATLLEFLRSGEDLATNLGFIVGESGLDEWPSVRAFLLDLLGKIDPEMASQYALDSVIPAKSSTVEYAISLQILWNHGGAEKSTPELTQAWIGLLHQPDWAAQPDASWMESLDFASRIPDAMPEFLKASTEWLSRPREASGKAETAEMVLERMMIRNPEETLSALMENSHWLSEGRGPAVRASLFARVDASDPEQALSLKNYLLHLKPEEKEADSFYQAFPCHNYGVAPGLSGQPDIPGAEEIQKMLHADLILLHAFENDPSVAMHRPWIGQAMDKIREVLGPKD